MGVTNTNRMRCLLITEPVVDGVAIQMARASLRAMGIDYERAVVNLMPANSYVNSFDFICMAQASGTAASQAVFNNTNLTVPIFALKVNGFHTRFGLTPGVVNSRTTLASQFFDVPWSSEKYLALHTGTYELTDGVALATISAVVPPGITSGGGAGAAQANAGDVFMWSTTADGGQKAYIESSWGGAQPMLPFLIQAAINDGVLSARKLRRAPMCLGIDHINGLVTHGEPTIVDKIASYVPAGKVITCGVATGSAGGDLANMPTALVDKLKKYSGTKLRYNYHEHRTGLQPTTGGWPSTLVTNVQTKAQQSANYDSVEALWNAYGLELHTVGLYNSASHSWDESTIELFSRDVSRLSDPNEATPQAGKGFCMFRTILASSRAATQKKDLYELNQHLVKRRIRGIQIFNTWDLSWDNTTTNPYNDASDWETNFRYITQSVSNGMDMYIHATPFIAADQEPGVTGKQHGYTAVQMFADVGNYLKDVADLFARPEDHIV